LTSALTIALSYVVGGIIPLFPYMLTHTPREGLLFSVIVTMCALAVFGFIKGRFTGLAPARSAAQTLIIGGLAAAAAYLLARLIS
jgi:VIT1/CCC1 family predicted Fe2+/Mn2+ transporter